MEVLLSVCLSHSSVCLSLSLSVCLTVSVIPQVVAVVVMEVVVVAVVVVVIGTLSKILGSADCITTYKRHHKLQLFNLYFSSTSE